MDLHHGLLRAGARIRWRVGASAGRAAIAGVAVSLGGCTARPADLSTALQVTDLTTGWFDAGIVESGKNKLVPSLSFRLKNTSDVAIAGVQINAVFRRAGESEEWASAFVRGIGREGLRPGASTLAIVLRSQLGYTGTEPRSQMLENRQFVDAGVKLFAKRGSAQWVKLAEHRVQRQLLTR